MKVLFFRYLIGLIISIILSEFNYLNFDEKIIQALFTVLGIGYSIAISNIISFDTSELMFNDYRRKIIKHLRDLRNVNSVDFLFASFIFVCCLSFPQQIFIYYIFKINLYTFASIILFLSICSLVIGFFSLQKLNEEVSDKIAKEKSNEILNERLHKSDD